MPRKYFIKTYGPSTLRQSSGQAELGASCQMKKYYIKTYGCQMNENDSEILAGILESKGYSQTQDIQSSDIILVNTCSVRDSAERKANGFIYALSELKSKNPGLLVGVIGCMAERLGEDILKKFKIVDFAIGPNKENNLGDILDRRQKQEPKILETGDSHLFKDSTIAKRQKGPNAWITIMEGCDNFCSYCVVPYVRGREKSRTIGDITGEIEALDKNIFKEVTLLGQNVNSYSWALPAGRQGFSKLLREVSKIEGILRIRFMTSHPKDMTDEIIGAIADNSKICENFHLPLQSGDDDILEKMNRGYTRDYYIKLVERIRSKIPSAAITSDAIAGFPGETEKQFQNTVDLISSLELDSVNTLAFNLRPGTAAAAMGDQLPKEIIDERLQILMRAVEETLLKKNQKLIGSVCSVLVENSGSGRTRTNKIIKFPAQKERIGDIISVKISAAKSWVLQGELIN